MYKLGLASALFLGLAMAHQDPTEVGTDLYEKPPEGVTWQAWHMKSEHGIDDFDIESVFKLHDTRNSGFLNAHDILKMYGLLRDEVVGKGDGMGSHDASEGITKQTKENVVSKIMALIDTNSDGEISFEEWKEYSSKGGEFPDMGVGVGHELDFEGEYERHHWLEHHAQNDPDVHIQHPEDIEHELLHHEHEVEHAHDGEDGDSVVNIQPQVRLEKIPLRFRRN